METSSLHFFIYALETLFFIYALECRLRHLKNTLVTRQAINESKKPVYLKLRFINLIY